MTANFLISSFACSSTVSHQCSLPLLAYFFPFQKCCYCPMQFDNYQNVIKCMSFVVWGKLIGGCKVGVIHVHVNQGYCVPLGRPGCPRPHTSSGGCWIWPRILMWPSASPKTILHSFVYLISHVLTCTFFNIFHSVHF